MQKPVTFPENEHSVKQSASHRRAARATPRHLSGLRIISLIIVGIVLLPLVYLGLSAAGAGQDGLDYLLTSRTLSIVTNSLWLVVSVTASAGAIGIPFAWLTTRTDLPFRRVWLVLGLLAMVIPSYLAAVTYVAVFGPVGILQGWLERLAGIQRLPDIHGFAGAWFAITLFTYPYVVLPVRAALINTDPALEEAGYSMGLSRWQVFRRITFPQLLPAMAGGMLLAGMYALSDFGAVAVMRYNAFTRAIFLQQTSFRMERAAVLALVLVILTLLLLALEWRINNGRVNYRVGTGTKRQLKPVQLGKWTLPALLFCSLVVALGVAVPVGVLFYWFVSGLNTTSPIPIDMPALVFNTAGVSAVTALVVAIIAIPLVLLIMHSQSKANHWIVALAYTGNVLPGIVIALALVFFAARYALPVYQTIPLLVLGYVTRLLPYSISSTRSALTQINPRLEEVARCLGLPAWKVIILVTVPLAKTGIVAGAALVFLSAMKELPITLILRPIGFETFSTRIWTFYGQAFLPQIGLPGFVLMGVSTLGLVIVLWQARQHGH